jgi:HEAT repeat protein
MAFVKSTRAEPAASPETTGACLAQLASPDAGIRRRAARALAGDPGAATTLAERLEVETEPSVRNALFGSLVAIGGAPAAGLVAPFVRSEDAALRGGAIDALKQLDEAAITAVDELLNDPDPDLRLLAIEVTRAWPSERSAPRLQRIFLQEPHVNVCAAALDVATEAGGTDLLPALQALRQRFQNEMFLLFAVDVARARIGNPAETDA